ncbi:MAG: elongator complex protein 3 [Filifactoraceae bacterium]
MDKKNKKKTISIFVPHVGCPNDCVFCNQRRITGFDNIVDENTVKSIIEEHLVTISADVVELAFFGGSFTAIELKLQKELLGAVEPYIKSGKISYIRVSTRPDAIDEDKLKMLQKFHVKIIELGVQSLDEQVLFASNRGHNSSCVFESSKLIKSYGFELGLQMMVGLPKDDKESIIKTALDFVKIEPKYVRIYPVLVIRDTQLEEQLNKNRYTPIGIEKTVDIVSSLIAIFELNNIIILRVGLQNSESISMENSVVAGPFHPSLGELCYSRLYRKLLDMEFENLGMKGTIELRIWKKNISKVVGNNKSNIRYFNQKGIDIRLIATEEDIWKISNKINEKQLVYRKMLKDLLKEEVKGCY